MKKLFILLISAALVFACNNKSNNQQSEQNETADLPQSQEEQQTSAQPEIGKVAPDFTLNDLDGKPLKLSSLRGKHVVIDFWATWCVWCIKGMPEMKKYYDKYSDKLEIISVDCEDAQEDWKLAVEENNMTWKNVYDENGKVNQLYQIEGFPTKIVLDTEGKILKVVEGEDPAFYTYLDELFK